MKPGLQAHSAVPDLGNDSGLDNGGMKLSEHHNDRPQDASSRDGSVRGLA
jgi:hypothetical protein